MGCVSLNPDLISSVFLDTLMETLNLVLGQEVVETNTVDEEDTRG